jgi:hypothetical protein
MYSLVRNGVPVLLVCLACGSGYKAQHLTDGSYRVKCVDSVDRCVREAQRVCGKEPYSVLGGHKETKLYGGDTGYQTGAELHTLEFRCGAEAAKPAQARPSKSETTSAPAAPAPAPTSSCTPGATQKCYGPGACEGGQRCNDKGTAFLPCDCGEPRGSEGGGFDDEPEADHPGESVPSTATVPSATE